VFSPTRPSAATIDRRIAAARDLPPATPALLTLLNGPIAPHTPRGFVHDVSNSQLGHGSEVFERACRAFAQWTQFDLGWVRVANPTAPPLRFGSVVVVEAHTLGLWSLSLNRITETVSTPYLFGFIHATTGMHVVEGRERFLLMLDPTTGAVTYSIEAISRPRHPLAKLAYPVTRVMQLRFAGDSHLRLRHAVNPEST